MRLFDVDDFALYAAFDVIGTDVDPCQGDLGLMERYA
jgi:hypothetical protein